MKSGGQPVSGLGIMAWLTSSCFVIADSDMETIGYKHHLQLEAVTVAQ